MTSARGRESSRLLSLPDELLQPILARVDHPRDRCSLALSCSHLRRLSCRTPHSIRRGFSVACGWMKKNVVYFGVFTRIVDLTVEVSSISMDQLLRGIGAGCERFESCRNGAFFLSLRIAAFTFPPTSPLLSTASSPPFISLVTSLELDSPFDRQPLSFNAPLPPPVDAFPSLRSLTLLYKPSHYRFISCCSTLTSLTLWRPNAFALYSLASPSSPLRLSLASLTIQTAWLEAALTPLASFPRLASLSFHSCSIDPGEFHALSRSLHTLTHLALHDCPLVSSHSIATLAQANLALSSVSLHSTSYPLFISQGLRNLLRSCSSRLHTLTLSGLPSYRPGMLARCNSLQRLTLKGRKEASEEVAEN
ncbi:unnamed protein product [Closterium sp. Naga37s-1]|nr:unnamed protein product [Closterium sp. Naga37s-1]